MNGRAYDPLFAQMLSPDPTTQFPGFSQGYERYSYCMNNPLKYTDPTGFSVNDEILVDEETGKQQVISDRGGDDINFYYYGHYEKDGPDAGAFESDRTEVVDNTTKYDLSGKSNQYGAALGAYGGSYVSGTGYNMIGAGASMGLKLTGGTVQTQTITIPILWMPPMDFFGLHH